MSVRPHPTKGKGYWIVDYYPAGRKGKRSRDTFKGTEGQALAYEQDQRRGPGQAQSLVSPLIKDLVSDWLDYYATQVQPRTLEDAIDCMAHWLPVFGFYKPANLSRSAINEYKTARLQKVKKVTINKELSYFSSLLKWAAQMGLCDDLSFKIHFFPKKQVTAPIVTPLTPRQVDNILKHIDTQYRLLYLLMSDMGLRRNEALAIQAEDVDEYRETISVIGKGAKQRIIPWLSNRFADELKKTLDSRSSGLLSINPKTNEPFSQTVKWLYRAATSAKIKRRVHPHLLRHTCLSNLAMQGMSPHALQQIAGHSSIETTNKIYVHIRSDYVKMEAEKIRKNS